MKPPTPEKTFAQVSRLDSTSKLQKTVLSSATDDFYGRYESSADPTRASPENAQAMLNAGRVLIELNCEEYLDAIGQSAQAAGNLRQQTNLVGGLSSALMGVGGASAGGIAGVASTFSFLGASMDAYSAAYLFADAGTSVIKLVHSAQELFMDEVNRNLQNTVLDHTGAMHILMGYQSICRPAKIRALVNSAISKAQVVAEIAPDNGVDVEVTNVLGQLRSALNTPVSEAEAIKLYARMLKPDTKAPLPENERKLSAAQLAEISNIFLPLMLQNSRVGHRWRLAIAGAQPETPLAVQQVAISAKSEAKDAGPKGVAANTAGALDVARQTADVVVKSNEAINEVLRGGSLEKAKDIADAAKIAADKASESQETSSTTPRVAQAAKTAADAAQRTAIAAQGVVDKAIASRNSQPPRMSQFSLPIIGIAR
ncbi:hypothetical protein [Variovorax sp. GB1P17]|uniref:hypothetical protein n=1 Tax=Variovorax sp. GB1P17 TaxID=3443740 RepID=UPI003F496534